MLNRRKNYTLEGGVEHRSKVLLIFGVMIFVLLIGCLIAFWPKTNETSLENINTQNDDKVSLSGKVSGRYLFSGTIVLARAVERYAAGDYSQPFSQLSSFEPDKYDAWMADLECPVTNTKVSYQEQITNLTFNCDTAWLPNYAKYFNLANLANNHTKDMGREGFNETQKNLQEAGVQVVGDYDPSVTENACEVISLPVKVKVDGSETEDGELPIAFCAFHYFFRNPKPGEMDVVKKYSDVMPVFGFMHVGVEYVSTAGTEQQAVARGLIDFGSEFVVGNSPHWVQNSEVYKGKPIFYSTGNFIFDQLEAETNRGLSVGVSISVNYDENIAKWLELGKQCRDRADDCLAKAKEQNLTKPQLNLSYEPVANISGARVVTKKGDASIQALVEQRLNWKATKSLLVQ